MKSLSPAAIALAMMLFLSFSGGCGGGATPPPPPAVVSQLSVTASASVTTAGSALDVVVRAVDVSGNVVSSYTGTVHFSSTDAQATMPTDSKLANGVGSFSVALKTAGNQSVSATDTVTSSVQGNLKLNVSPATASLLTVSIPMAATTGIAFNVAVSAVDAFNNVATNYSGTLHFASTDLQAVLPANSALAGGTGSFSATLKTVGAQTITATDMAVASVKGTSSAVNVVSNAATQIAINGPNSSTTRQSIQLTITALDGANNVSVGYPGTVHFSSSDAHAKLPNDLKLTAGTAVVSSIFETAGTETIRATDTATASLTGSASISVTAATDLTINSGPPPPGAVGAKYAPYTVYVCGVFGCGYKKFYGFALKASGGVMPYIWSWAPANGSSLPPGLNVMYCLFQGHPGACISGTPTQPGTYDVLLSVTDSGTPSVKTTSSYTITISNPPPPAVNTKPPFPAVENQPYSYTFTANGYPPLTWSESGPLPPGLAFDNNTGTISGTPTQTGSFPISVTATDQFNQVSAPADFSIAVNLHGFLPTGNMAMARRFHTGTLLCNGKVLVAGGEDADSNAFDSAEIYDPSTGTFSPTGKMTVPRVAHTATLLANCKVLVTGGATDVSEAAVSSAELYDPSTGTFTATTGSMTAARASHTATLLKDGRVLVVGGDVIFFNGVQNPGIQSLTSAELFDPGTGGFTVTGRLSTARELHTATLLSDGRVLVAGGSNGALGNNSPMATVLDSAELYDPSTGHFSSGGKMTTSRDFHTATLLVNGKVLIAGGVSNAATFLSTAELYDPNKGSFSATTGSMTAIRFYHDANLLNDGTVLLSGGSDGSSRALASAEIYNPNAGTFSSAGSMIRERVWHTSTLLKNGKVLVTGGADNSSLPTPTAETYQ